MNLRVPYVLGVLFAIAISIFIGYLITSGIDYMSVAFLGIFLAPLLGFLALSNRRLWIAIAIGIIPFAYKIPTAVFNRFTPAILAGALIIALVAGAYTMGYYRKPVLSGLGTRLIFATSLIVWARFLYDRPGSAVLGSASGGGGQALTYVLAFAAFWIFSKLAAERIDPKELVKWLFLLIMGIYLFGFLNVYSNTLKADDDDKGGLIYLIYHRAGWMVAAMVFTWIIVRYMDTGKTLFNQMFTLAIVGLMGISATTPHRSRPVFAIGTILGISYVFNFHRKAFFITSFCGFLLLLGLMAMGEDRMPLEMRRSLSVFLPFSEEDAQSLAREQGVKLNTETGWRSEWRSLLYDYSWQKTMKNPLMGDGFAFSGEELMKLYANVKSGTLVGMETPMMQRAFAAAIAGNVHNALLFLMATCGIPAALFCLFGILSILWKYGQFARSLPRGDLKILSAVLIGFCPPIAGQMLMNGAGKDLFNLMLILGVMNGILHNKECLAQAPEKTRPKARVVKPKNPWQPRLLPGIQGPNPHHEPEATLHLPTKES